MVYILTICVFIIFTGTLDDSKLNFQSPPSFVKIFTEILVVELVFHKLNNTNLTFYFKRGTIHEISFGMTGNGGESDG